ncbi:MAG: hypothetical protein WCG34_05020 [Leptolinea sp.]
MRERTRRERSRTPWYLLTGLLLGLAAGLGISVWWWPVPYNYAAPSELNGAAKDQYRLSVARAYQSNRDSGRAYPRLDLLMDSDKAAVLSSQAQRSLAARSELDSQALALLAAGLDPAQRPNPAIAIENSPTVEPTLQAETTNTPSGIIREITPQETAEPGTPQATFAPISIPSAEIPRATPTLFPTLSAPFIMKERAVDCKSSTPGLLQIWIGNAGGQAIPGVRIQIAWKDGEEAFFTGLKPEINAGYADYEMTRDLTYSLRVGENGETINDLGVADCTSEGRPELAGGVILRFTEK